MTSRQRNVGLAAVLALSLGAAVAVLFWVWREGRWEHSQDEVIRAAALRYDMDPALIKAVVWRESRFDPEIQGRAQEIGLMQIREEAAMEWAEAERIKAFEHGQCFDPRTNALAGTWYLRKYLRRYLQTDDPRVYALAAYNAGPGNAARWSTGAAATNSAVFLEQMPFPGTRAYIKAVLERTEKYRPEFRSQAK